MLRILAVVSMILFVTLSTLSAEENAEDTSTGDKLVGGMSIVGNDEAPKSLVIVPWKSSEMGDAIDVSRALDDGRDPVDRDVFMRELEYYRIRSGEVAGATR